MKSYNQFIKLFENKAMDIDYRKNICWIIFGDLQNVINVITKITDNPTIKNNKSYCSNLEELIKRLKKNIVSNIEGIIIFSRILTWSDSGDYTPMISYEEFYEFDEIYKIINNRNLTLPGTKFHLLGELRIKNDKAILDTAIVDMKKYNL